MGLFDFGRGNIGLDIGTSAVRAAEVRGGDKSPTVARFGQVLLPRGAVVNGEVQEPSVVGQAISTLWKRAGFSGRGVRIGIGNRRVVVRQIELPAMAREDLEGAIRFQAQDYIPIPLPEAVMDFEVLEELSGDEGEPLQRVLVVAAERVMIDSVLAAVHAAKLEPETVELNAYPLVRALGGEAAVAPEVEAIIDVGGGVTNVVIHQGGKIRFTRLLPNLGGDDFTQSIVDALDLDWEEAESLKYRASGALARQLGIEVEEPLPRFESEEPEPEELEIGGPEEEGLDIESLGGEDEEEEPPADLTDLSGLEGEGEDEEAPEDLEEEVEEPPEAREEPEPVAEGEQVERAVEALNAVLQRFVGEIRGSVDFYTTQQEALPLRAVVLTGGGSLLAGLAEQVSTALQVPVERAHVFDRVPAGKVKLSADQIDAAEPFLGVAVGLALGGLES